MKSLPQKPSTATSRSRSRAIELIHVHAVAFIAGGVVMVLEILGTRVIGPVFGVTLFVWAALLSVTLGALAAGYFTGGVLVDRYPSVRLLGHILLAASLLTVFGSAASTPILRASLGIGPRLGPMLSAP